MVQAKAVTEEKAPLTDWEDKCLGGSMEAFRAKLLLLPHRRSVNQEIRTRKKKGVAAIGVVVASLYFCRAEQTDQNEREVHPPGS
jgi:hypothetical protein